MKTLTELIQNYQNGIPDSDSEILKRMEPLVKGYASRIHCMEREDSTQELYLTLLKTLPYLSSSSSEGECIRYMQTSVENRYRSLCRSCLSEPEKDDFDSCSVSLQAPDSFDDTYYDVTAYIEYSNAIVHAFQGFRAPFSGKIVHIFPEQSAAFN